MSHAGVYVIKNLTRNSRGDSLLELVQLYVTLGRVCSADPSILGGDVKPYLTRRDTGSENWNVLS